jgi:glycosyltransferase involved in cell wall biosynthesis
MGEPTFSVVMPAFDAALTIGASIHSVLAQTRADWQLIVVDDGSRDATAAVVESFDDPRITLIRKQNGGAGSARNAALEIATGEYISLLDSDDLYLPTYLDRMGSALNDDPGAALAYTQAWVLDDRTGRVRRRTTAEAFQPWPEKNPEDPAEIVRELTRGSFVFVATTARRSVYRQLGGFRRDVWAEDYEMWLRFARAGHRFTRVSEPLVIYRRSDGSLSARSDLDNRTAVMFELLADDAELDAETRTGFEERARADRARLEKAGAPVERTKTWLRSLVRRLAWKHLTYSHPPEAIAATLALTLHRSSTSSGGTP